MKPRLRTIVCTFTALVLGGGPLRAADPGAKYQPQLAPVFTAGETFTYHATVEFRGLERIAESTKKPQKNADGKVTNVRSDKVLQSDQAHFMAELSADALARKVYKNGSLQEAEFLVRRCELTDDKGDSVELLPAGVIIGARKQADGQVAFAVNGKTPATDVGTRLSILIPMGDEHTTSSDILGAPAPVPVGATWAVNEKAMLKSDLPRIFPGVDRLAGSVALRSAQPDRTGIMRTTVTSNYQLGDVEPPFPQDVIANPSDVRFEITVTAPVPPARGQFDQETNVLIRHTGHTGDIQVGMSETDMEVGFTIDQEVQYGLGGNVPNAALTSAPLVPEMPPLPPGMSSAPVLRPNGPALRPVARVVEDLPNSTAPAPASPKAAAPPSSTRTSPTAVPPLVVPSSSPFSGAQDLPSLPPDAK